jgi:hypothetical protein
MPMPETALDLDRRTVSWQRDVWASGKISHVQTVTQPEAMQCTPQIQLGLGVFSPNTRHHP